MERMLQITNWDGIALDHLASRDIPQLIEQVCINGCPTVRTSLGTPLYVLVLAETIVEIDQIVDDHLSHFSATMFR